MCIITNKKGSAANDEDVPIDEQYKFADPIMQEVDVVSRIQSCFDEYDVRINDFESYRQWIRGERDRFINEVKDVKIRILGE